MQLCYFLGECKSFSFSFFFNKIINGEIDNNNPDINLKIIVISNSLMKEQDLLNKSIPHSYKTLYCPIRSICVADGLFLI